MQIDVDRWNAVTIKSQRDQHLMELDSNRCVTPQSRIKTDVFCGALTERKTFRVVRVFRRQPRPLLPLRPSKK